MDNLLQKLLGLRIDNSRDLDPRQAQQAAMQGAFTPGSQVPGLQVLANGGQRPNPAQMRGNPSLQRNAYASRGLGAKPKTGRMMQSAMYNPQDMDMETIVNPQRYNGLGWAVDIQGSNQNPYRFRGL